MQLLFRLSSASCFGVVRPSIHLSVRSFVHSLFVRAEPYSTLSLHKAVDINSLNLPVKFILCKNSVK